MTQNKLAKTKKKKPHRRSRGTHNIPKGDCPVCKQAVHHGMLKRGKAYVDGDGVKQRSADSVYHVSCWDLARRGLTQVSKTSFANGVGQECRECSVVIEDKAVHVFGAPYHPECKPERRL